VSRPHEWPSTWMHAVGGCRGLICRFSGTRAVLRLNKATSIQKIFFYAHFSSPILIQYIHIALLNMCKILLFCLKLILRRGFDVSWANETFVSHLKFAAGN
jgi:hypothetical protein